MEAKKILIVEDEPTLAQILSEYLIQAGFDTHIVHDGGLAIDALKAYQADLMILDLMLPNRDGLDIYRELRRFSDLPVIMATAKVEEIDRLLGLELGADDYICKPYSTRELVVRVKNILRRTSQIHASEMQESADAKRSKNEMSAEGVLLIYPEMMQVKYNNKTIHLTPAEFKILSVLFEAKGRIFSRDRLMSYIYPDHRVVSDRTIDSHIKNLRKKLMDVSKDLDCIKSVYGMGYKYSEEV